MTVEFKTSPEWVAVESLPLETDLGMWESEAMATLCLNLSDVIRTIQKDGALVDRLEYVEKRGVVRVLFRRQKVDTDA